MPLTKEIGDRGEELAARLLTQKGYTVLDRNVRSRYGEIDIICADHEYIVFVEVKTRGAKRLGSPGEAVDFVKRRKFVTTVKIYLAKTRDSRQPRFDVVEVFLETAPPKIRHIENAFDLSRK